MLISDVLYLITPFELIIPRWASPHPPKRFAPREGYLTSVIYRILDLTPRFFLIELVWLT